MFTPDVLGKPTIPNGLQSGGPYTATRWNVDIYSAPGTVSFANAYTVAPQVLRFTSHGNLVLGETAYDTARLIALNSSDGPAANTITRIGCFGNHTQRGELPPIGAWLWLDCDKAGMCGPLDDIIITKNQDNYSAAHYIWRISLSFTCGHSGISVVQFRRGALPSGPTTQIIGLATIRGRLRCRGRKAAISTASR